MEFGPNKFLIMNENIKKQKNHGSFGMKKEEKSWGLDKVKI